jgi:hypothetical protein
MSKQVNGFESEVRHCRLCGSNASANGMSLGTLAFTGIFPTIDQDTPTGLLELFHCSSCDLIQTNRNFDRNVMYGDNYGYRSGLNASMASHLTQKIQNLIKVYSLPSDSVIVDIGSNDGTMLNAVPQTFRRVGVDPTIRKFSDFYDPEILQVAEFFDQTTLSESANIITTISMFYDLPNVNEFVQNLLSILDTSRGIWHMEQAYWPQTVRTLGYDTICHEHLEYYSLSTIVWIAKKYGLKIIDFGFNDINGGSFYVDLSHGSAEYKEVDQKLLNWVLNEERSFLNNETLQMFEKAMLLHADSLHKLLQALKVSEKSVIALGASTKGNVLLQVAQLNSQLIEGIGEINENKFGKVTPGTSIPIQPENVLLEGKPDYVLILPWHFATGIVDQIRKQSPSSRVIVPLPHIRII